MRSDIIYRITAVIRHVADPRRRLKHLEEETGIPDRNWKQVWSGKQRPTAHMIESLSRRWPQYAFWVATGITDEVNGHTAPPNAWTCNQALATPYAEETATRYFNLKIFLQDVSYGPRGSTLSDYVAKKNPSEQELLDAAAALPKSDDPDTQALFDVFFGKEIVVSKLKYSDLDHAIAQIAFEKRKDALQSEFSEIDPTGNWITVFENTVDELQKERGEAKKYGKH